jgi:hypothetical protein
MAQHAGGKGLPSATIGNERETLVGEFLEKVFPSKYRFGSGVITDSEENLSGQIDIVVELPLAPSFPMLLTRDRLYPAEAVGAVIEVKSDLSKQWDEVERTVEQVKRLNRKLLVTAAGRSPREDSVLRRSVQRFYYARRPEEAA